METLLVIEGQLDGLNEYTRAGRAPKRGATMQAKMKRENQEIISWYIKAQIPDVRFTLPVELSFKWYEPNKRRDLDNICFAKKFILDALVENEIIQDDNQKYVKGFTDEFYTDDERPRVEVVIKEVSDYE